MPSKVSYLFKRAAIFPLLLFFLNDYAWAEGCQAPRIILTINGVLNNKIQAENNMLKLRFAWLGLSRSQQTRPNFYYMHNPSAKDVLYGIGGLADFLETAMQRHGLNISLILRGLAGLEPLPDGIKDDLINWANLSVKGYNPDAATLNYMRSTLDAYIDQGNIVTLVPHSQGNLWASSIVNLMNPSEVSAVGNVGVAVPYSRVDPADRSAYVTLVEDMVILALKLTDSSVLSGNVANGYPPPEWKNRNFSHNFTEAYLDIGKLSEKKIITSIDEQFSKLEPAAPCPPPTPAPFYRYLPKLLEGSRAGARICGPDLKMDGLMTFGSSGEITGSRCFKEVTFPENSYYKFGQSYDGGGIYLYDSAGNTLNIRERREWPTGNVELFWKSNPVRQGVTSTFTSRPLIIDMKTRILDWIRLISNKTCTARGGSVRNGSAPGAHVELSETHVSIVRGNEIFVSAPITDILWEVPTAPWTATSFSERRNQTTFIHKQPSLEVSTANTVATVNLTILDFDNPSPSVFSFDSRFSTNALMPASCTTESYPLPE
ncbi:hypothetical protein C8R21_102145 [Nitrosospira multiformis]|uniref:Uncharacterized protein n=1 Tax=Nitrosospira multiformis TaxID=1231 RepID=A0A2T5IH62_9PROT|nr:hypothetical protein [Nitrosospira multiformis]PTQ83142.1 hypothetical protein C8R21_102145 [Nitrosospira multiformis]